MSDYRQETERLLECLRCSMVEATWLEHRAALLAHIERGRVPDEERRLRRLLAARVAMPNCYMDDGEAHGHEHGISIDFMREPVADIDAKIRALNVARAVAAAPAVPATCMRTDVACAPREQKHVPVYCTPTEHEGRIVYEHTSEPIPNADGFVLYAAPAPDRFRAAAKMMAVQPACMTCSGHGMVGGLLPNGGGYQADPCHDCAAPVTAGVLMPKTVAYGFGNTAITGHTNRLMMVRIDIPGGDQYAGAFWLPLVLADEAHTYGVACRAAGEAAGYVRGLRDAVRDAAPLVQNGEVLVTVTGLTGSGKSAIAGEIEIMCRALGLEVEWGEGAAEKHLTHADWTNALEMYRPRVRIVEANIPRTDVALRGEVKP